MARMGDTQDLGEQPGARVALPPAVESPPAVAGHIPNRALSRLLKVIQHFPPARLAQLDAAVIIGLGVMGGLEFFTSAQLGLFDLDAEGTIPAAFSAGLLFAAALLALAIAQAEDLGKRERHALWFMTVFFTYMGVDEGLSIHERAGGALGVHWQIPYLPVVAVAAVLWLRVLRVLSTDASAAKLWIAGAAVWVGAQAFETVQSAFAPVYGTAHGTINLHFAFTIPEETGEMIGSSLFLFALLLFLRTRIAIPSKRRRTRIAIPPEPDPSLTKSEGAS
jgi:hypothetical protein